MWNDTFRIGDGERTTDETASPVYRSYADDCEITMTEDMFNEINEKYKIYFVTEKLKNIQFTPATVPTQGTSDYYFCRLDFKIPRNS